MKKAILIFFVISSIAFSQAKVAGTAPNLRYVVWLKDTSRISIPDSIFRALPCGVLFRDTINGIWFVKPCGGTDSLALAFPDSIMVDSHTGLKRTQAHWLIQAQGCLKWEVRSRAKRYTGHYYERLDTLIIKDTCASGASREDRWEWRWHRTLCDTSKVQMIGIGSQAGEDAYMPLLPDSVYLERVSITWGKLRSGFIDWSDTVHWAPDAVVSLAGGTISGTNPKALALFYLPAQYSSTAIQSIEFRLRNFNVSTARSTGACDASGMMLQTGAVSGSPKFKIPLRYGGVTVESPIIVVARFRSTINP